MFRRLAFFALLSGRRLFRLIVTILTAGCCVCLAAFSFLRGRWHGLHHLPGPWAWVVLLIPVVVVAAQALRWQYDTVLYRLSPDDRRLFLSL